ncbi:MAG TPA: protein kinase [Pyrinomonadaceae bacterium]|nr:protein kinase [Pyrinomonadaceae bacterium]
MAMKIGTEMPRFEGATVWFNGTTAVAEERAKGHPTLVHFWAVSCGICKENLPLVAEWRDKYRERGLRVIAVHMPRYEEDTDTEVVREAIARLGMSEPCAVDNEHNLRDAFQNENGYTPFYYLFDAKGRLAGAAAGEHGLNVIGPALERIFNGPYCRNCDLILAHEVLYCPDCGNPVSSIQTEVSKEGNGSKVTSALPGPLTGRSLDGKYELLELLGEGGMSAVYRARRTRIGDEVAIKILLPKFVQDNDAIERFRREARAAAMLRHANVVTIYDFGEGPDEEIPAYIAMELVEGESLRRLLNREGAFSARRALNLMCGICAGVGAAHRREIIHRDLKPDNVIILPEDEDREYETPKVVDFGIAKLRDIATAHQLTQTGTLVGTPYYMSPEQCMGNPLDARSDVYSLGAMLYEILTGAPPFTAETVTGIIAKHLYEEPAPLPQSLGFAPAIDNAIRKALAKNPADRQANATELGRELRAAL